MDADTLIGASHAVANTQFSNAEPVDQLQSLHPGPLYHDQECCPEVLPTPIRVGPLNNLLSGYSEVLRRPLIQGFTEGFSIGFTGVCPPFKVTNLKSALSDMAIVDGKISDELTQGRVAGPFPNPPFPNFVSSPLGLVPKKAKGKFRLIHHLSFPHGSSVNDGIPPDSVSVRYASIDDAVIILRTLGKGTYMAKTDIASAFRLIPITSADHHLLGFSWRDQFYYDKCLPMGCSMSCKLFESFSSALEWIAKNKLHIPYIIHVLDDFLFLAPTFESCKLALNSFLALCGNIGVPIAHEKTMGPSTCLEFLGITLDSIKQEARLPIDKLEKGKTSVTALTTKRKATLKELQGLLGFLNFTCSVIVPGRAFLRRLYSATKGLTRSYHHVRVNSEMRADLMAWKLFLKHFNGRAFFIHERWITSTAINLHTDASTTIGFGAIFGSRWTYGTWPSPVNDLHITILELYPIVLAMELWGHLWANHCLVFHTDNIALIPILANNTSKDATIMVLVRRLVGLGIQFNILFKAVHVPGKDNVLADFLSRSQISKFRALSPLSDPLPTTVPEHLLLPSLLGR